MVTFEVRNDICTPVIGGREVAEVVQVLHDAPLERVDACAANIGLPRKELEAALTFCAERRCAPAEASCGACRRRTEHLRLHDLDAFVASHRRVSIANGAMVLTGNGRRERAFQSLEALATTWAGEEYWFYARRIIRKLRYGVRTKADPRPVSPRHRMRPAVILMEPQLVENVGMVARAMANFGLDELRLVNPRDGWPNEKARIAASGATFVVDEASHHETFHSAIADLNYVVATTARQRDLAKPVLTPQQAIEEIARRTAEGERCGILFGRERNGLETREVADTDAIVMIPVDPKFASLNLAQSVLVLAYEWIKHAGGGTLGRVTTYETPVQPGLGRRRFRAASKEELLAFFEHLENELEAHGFFNSADKRPVMIQNLRTMFTRLGASEQEVRTLRGIVKALTHGNGRPDRG